MTNELKELVTYRMSRAAEALKEAETLLLEGLPHGALNRLYYACFHAASAFLLANGYSSSKHSGMRALFHQKVVKPGSVGTAHGKTYVKLFILRQKADYEDMVKLKIEEVKTLRDVSFINQVKKLVSKEISK